jgi:hypothetical protein
MTISDDKAERAGGPSNAELAKQLLKDADLLEDCTPGGLESTEAIARVRLAAARLKAETIPAMITVGHGRFHAGVKVSTVQGAIDRMAARLETRSEISEALKDTLRMLEAAYRQLGMWSKDNPRIMKARAALAAAIGGKE